MHPKEIEIYFETALEHKVRPVLDGSRDSWERVVQVCMDLMESLPGRIETVSFLGSRDHYNISLASELDRMARNLVRIHGDRPALLNPVAEAHQQAEEKSILVIISEKCPIDLDDWTGDNRDRAMVFVNPGSNRWHEGSREIMGPDPVRDIVESVSNPPVSVLVQGPGFFPLRVDAEQGEVHLDQKGNSMRLSVDGLEPDRRFSLRVKGLAISDPELEIERGDGAREIVRGKHIPSWFQKEVWAPLAGDAAVIVEAGMKRTDFTCPFCGEEHGYTDIFCPRSSKNLLSGMPLKSTILFRDGTFLVLDGNTPGYPLDNGESVITNNGRIYDWNGYEWIFSREIEPYEEVEHGIHALYTDI